MRARNGIWIALSLLFALTAAFVLRETRGTTLWFDEWQWAMDRRGGGLSTFLDPHNGHLSLVPVLVYKLLFATGGLTDYLPYRIAIVIAHLACTALVFVYLRARVGDTIAALGAVLILLLGPAWENILWPFQIGSVTSLATGIGALLALDVRRRAWDVAASVLVALSLASTSLGVVVLIGVTLDLLCNRRRPRDLWIVAGPTVLYALWWLAFQDSDFVRHNVVLAPGFAADAAAGTFAALTGLSGVSTTDSDPALPWGPPLAVAAAGLLAWRLRILGRVPPRAFTLLAMVGSFWLLTAVQRAHLVNPASSRYVYVGAVLCLLLAAELAQGAVVSKLATGALAGLVGLVSLANLGDLRDVSRFLRDQSANTRADLAALEIARAELPAAYIASAFHGAPYLQLRADRYFAAADDLGSPAYGPERLATAPKAARAAADREFVTAEQLALSPTPNRGPTGPSPRVDAAAGGSAVPANGCVRFRPDAAGPATAVPELQLTSPRGGVRLTTGAGSTTVAVRRFADGFPDADLARLDPESSAALPLRPDAADPPWHVRVRPESEVTVCGLP